MKILCFGDSITWGYTPSGGRYPHPWPDILQSCLPDAIITAEGMPGRTAYGSLSKLKRILSDTDPDITLIMLGSNDLSGVYGRTVPEVISDLLPMGKASEQYGKTVLMAPPLISEKVDPEWDYSKGISERMKRLADDIRDMAVRENWYFFNTQRVVSPSVPDGLHLNAENQEILGKAIAEYLKESI